MGLIINSNLDIWSPQLRAEEIVDTLNNIDNSGKIILFTNLESELVIENSKLVNKFKICLWVKQQIPEGEGIEKNGRLIMFMDGSKFSKDTIISNNLIFKKGTELDLNVIQKILKEKNINYLQLDSVQEKDNSVNDLKSSFALSKEIWPIRNLEVLESSISDTTKKEVLIYPSIESKLTFKYYENKDTGYLIDQRDFAGMIEFNDKMVLLIKPTLTTLRDYNKDGSGHELGYKPIDIEESKRLLQKRGFVLEEREDLPIFLQENEAKSK